MFNDINQYYGLKRVVVEFSRKDENTLTYKGEVIEEKLCEAPERTKLWSQEVRETLQLTPEKIYYEIKESNNAPHNPILKIEGMRAKNEEEKGNLYHLIIEANIPLIDFKGVYHTLGFSLPLEEGTFYLNKAVIDANTAEFDLRIGNHLYKIKANRRPCYSCGITNLWEVTYEHIKRIKR